MAFPETGLDVEYVRTLGHGTTSRTALVRSRPHPAAECVAKTAEASPDSVPGILKELTFLQSLSHPRLLRYVSSSISKEANEVVFLLQYLPNSTG